MERDELATPGFEGRKVSGEGGHPARVDSIGNANEGDVEVVELYIGVVKDRIGKPALMYENEGSSLVYTIMNEYSRS